MITYSPRIVTDGLILYVDTFNVKSYVGEPTTNLVYGGDGMSGGSWAGYCGNISNVTYNTTDTLDPMGNFGASKLVRNANTSCGASTSFGLFWPDSIITASVTYTVSIWLKGAVGGEIMELGFHDTYPDYTVFSITNTWQRYTFTAAVADSDRGFQFLASNPSCTIFFWGPQLEQKSHATQYITAVAAPTTRTVTQGLLDLNRTNTFDLTNATFDSNAQLVYSGSGFIISPENSALNVQSLTMESWINPTTTAQNGFIFEKGNVNTQYSNFFDNSYFVFVTTGLSIPAFSFLAATYIIAGKWNHIVCTYSSGVKTIYVNGNQVAQQTGLTGTIAINTHGSSIGIYGGYDGARGYPFNGSIGIVRVYNRALSSSETIQNYNAHKSRYGL